MNDGDSFKVKDDDGRELHLRLYYVDSPETSYNGIFLRQRTLEQQRHFGLKDRGLVLDFGGRAADYTERLLSRPFTVHTRRQAAPGNRFYAFIETYGGHDLGHLLAEQGLVRIHGTASPAPDGTAPDIEWQRLGDLRDVAMLRRAGIWQETDPGELANMRKLHREEKQREKTEREILKNSTVPKDINLNCASQRKLETLRGIGPTTAAGIIAGRPYNSVDDLLRVNGIGKAILADLIKRHNLSV